MNKNKTVEYNYNEGLTLSYGGVKKQDGDKMIHHLFSNHKTHKLKDLSYVKVSNLVYDTDFFDEGEHYYLKNGNGLRTEINPNDLVSEWVGVVLHENGVERHLLKEWLGKFCGGLEYINEDLSIDLPMEVVDFDYEIITYDEIVKDFPLLKDSETEDWELDIQDYLDEISFHTSQIETLIDCFGMGDYPKEMEKFILFFKNNYNLKMLRKQIKKLKPKMEGVGI